MSVYYFRELFPNGSENYAASKGIYDVDVCLQDILDKNYINTSNVSAIEVEGKSKLSKICYYFAPSKLQLIRELLKIKGKNIFLQYPFYKGKIFDSILRKLIKVNRVFLIIHDVDSMRMPFGDTKKEIEILNLAYGLILMQGEQMKEYLISHGLRVHHIITMKIYDYIVKPFEMPKRSMSDEIIFAGNLRKSTFLHKIPSMKSPFQLNMYGPFYEQKYFYNANTVHYWGNYPPDKLLTVIKGSFGLIWDGTEINTEEGTYGEYNKYNIPFKFPMYLVAGMPVICWRQSSIAEFVRRNNLGMLIDSLEDIRDMLQSMTPDEYKNMLKNIEPLRNKLMDGFFMKAAIRKALSCYSDK